MKKSIMAKILAIIFVTGFVFLLMSFCDNIQYAIATEIPGVRNKDAYIRHSGNSWIFGTSSVERIVTLEGGKFLLKRFRDKVSGKELAAGSNEFSVTIGDVPGRVSGSSGGWKLVDYRETKLRQGELQLDITLRRDFLQVTKRYVIYPGSSIIREWVSIKNMGTSPLKIKEPGILDIGVRMGDPESLDLHWMSGSESIPGSWNLKTERLGPGTACRFDSYEPFAVPAGTLQPDGVEARILLNDSQVWPAQVWQHVANGYMHAPFDTILSVRSGDRIAFVVNMHRNSIGDNTTFDPTISFEGSEAHTASREFGDKQGMNGWSYQYIENGKFVDLIYSPVEKKWHKAQSNTTGACSIGESSQHPDSAQDVARVWTASSNGKVRVTGEVTNSGNYSLTEYWPRPGSMTYAPWYAVYNKDTKQGIFIGWDYFGHWVSSFDPGSNGMVTAQLKVAGYFKLLQSGDSIETPKAFVGLFRDDLDNAGNECLDWQYGYMWDYTREGWFTAIRMLGYWMKGTSWLSPAHSVDIPSTERKVFRTTDLMRYVGADVYHRDWGWWKPASNWKGPDWQKINEYLLKNDMGMLIYAPIQNASNYNPNAFKEHPDWIDADVLDMSKPAVVQFLIDQLSSFHDRWGSYEWRIDGAFTDLTPGHDDVLLGKDQGFRKVVKEFLDRYPDCAFQACCGGGSYAGYDYTRLSSSFSFSDGGVGILRNYWASLLLPPDKTSDIPDAWDPNAYEKSIWRGLLCINFDMTGDTWDPAKLEGIRELIDIYHYLKEQGVVGRWVKVYRPAIEGDDPTMYFQRMSGDRKKGIIITKHLVPGRVTIWPKGLIPDVEYHVSYQEGSGEEVTRLGRDLIEKGINLKTVAPGELVYLNLPLHPGSKQDKEPPTPPTGVTQKIARNMGNPGVELSWMPGTDNNWISYYEVLRDGKLVDKVAKGTYYFDHSAGADLSAGYEVRTVDGAGNLSMKVTTEAVPSIKRAIIYDDDGSGEGISFIGDWQHQTGLQPAHAGTITFSNRKGAAAKMTFEGKKLFLFSKLGDSCGKAAVSVDGNPAEIIDTYSADDIWGVCVFEKELPAAGMHTLRIEVLGEHSDRAKDSFIYIDGVRVER